jgi:hypothetical protein
MATGQMVSPGVYTSIIDLSQYLAEIPGTVGFIPILSKRGPDNKLLLVTSNEQYYSLYGQPNLSDYGVNFGQGPYVATQHLGVSSQLYVLRALPSDATYSHVVIGMQVAPVDLLVEGGSSSSVQSWSPLQMQSFYMPAEDYSFVPTYGGETETTTASSVNHIKILETLFTDANAASKYLHFDYSPGFPAGDGPNSSGGTAVSNGILMYFRTVGRGSSYNDFSISIAKNANKEMFGTYILNIYEIQASGDNAISESYTVSFDPTAVDGSGESMFIEDVVNKYSTNIICSVNRAALRTLSSSIDGNPASESYLMQYYKNDPTLPSYITEYNVLDDNGQKTELGYKATAIEYSLLDFNYAQFMLNAALTNLSVARALPSSTPAEITFRNIAITEALAAVSTERVAYAAAQAAIVTAYSLDIMLFNNSDIVPMQLGSEGSLLYADQSTGKLIVQPSEATQVLSDAYLGLLTKADDKPKVDAITGNMSWKTQYVDEVFDLDWIYFSLVYDAGYPVDAKMAANTLASIYRLDCMLVTDCGNNVDFYDCQSFCGMNPNEEGGWLLDSKYAARFEPYSRVYDTFTGKDIWISPTYHMSQLIPLNDKLYDIWFASAGFNRATLNTVKELRWSAKLGERDNLYLMQVNPIIHFPNGYTVWGNLTTQKRPSALQDINVMRMILYIKRALEQYCKYFIFEFNDQRTWDQIKAGIIPLLDSIKARRGLVNFAIDVGATDWEFKNKVCHVNVQLTPTKVIEKIALNLYIK